MIVLEGGGIFSGSYVLYAIIAGCAVAVTTIVGVIIFFCCRRRDANVSPDRSKKGYQKGNQNIKPPDLWIHHDQMEFKNLEKNQSSNDGASSSGAMTLPRSVGANDYDAHEAHHSNSLDKRSYIPSYMGKEKKIFLTLSIVSYSFFFCCKNLLLFFLIFKMHHFAFRYTLGNSTDEKNKRVVKPKPITLPVDSKPPRERKFIPPPNYRVFAKVALFLNAQFV